MHMEGSVGIVSGEIGPGSLGAVSIPVRGGSEEFLARAQDKTQIIKKGSEVVVTAYYPPRTVLVELKKEV